MGWTAEQLNAINEKNGNILVSAAAGSGKTAVLVERIIKLITDPENPVDIDRLLVVTFTRAAAAEMKERIGAAVSAALMRSPESSSLKRQAVLLNHADITTIHSFCLKVARENYSLLGIDPAFRVADDMEIMLIKDEIISRLFEEKYASDSPEEFLYLVEHFGGDMTDDRLKELVLKIYEFTRSCPSPRLWLEKHKEAGDGEKWLKELEKHIRVYLEGAAELTKAAIEIAESTGPETYIPMLENDLCQIENMLTNAEDRNFFIMVSAMEFQALSRKKCDSETKEKVKAIRTRVKKIFEAISTRFLLRSYDDMKADVERAGYGIKLLLELTADFAKMFDEEKKQRRIADYGDLEHYCLEVLLDKNSENPTKSRAAEELTKNYAYVMTDEYQDSNAVQELILTLVSNGKNRFMVGDVKQSIYSFRMADPEIFTEKYNSFSLKTGAENERIDMFRNFRSRSEILDGINFIFMQLMQRELGGIDYDAGAMLYAGAEYPMYIGGASAGGAVEVDVINSISDEDEEDLTNIQKEINFVADRINALMYGAERLEVFDKNDYRELRFSDIVILMRKKNYAAELVDILDKNGIPASAEVGTGFLETMEVMTILSFLRIIDNPRQDIPLAAVLKSPVYSLSADDLLTIRLESAEREYWDCVKSYGEKGTNERIKKILARFLAGLEKWRNMSVEYSINDLIWTVYTDTGYYDLAGTLPDGEARQENLVRLAKRASDYDSLSFKGLFDFVRYIEKMDKNNVEIDGASAGHGDSVRIMTIHKSKGLEFPVVFITGCGGKFNKTDLNTNVVMHKSMGIGSEYIDDSTRVRYNTAPRAVISETMLKEAMAEEIRILYVAMTRAKEKLIITGYANMNEAKILKWTMFAKRQEITLPPFEIAAADCFLDWIMAALSRHRCGVPVCNLDSCMPCDCGNGMYDHKSEFEINFVNSYSSNKADRLQTEEKSKTPEEMAFLREQINARLKWEYPYETGIPGSVSVSDVKKIRGIKLSHTIKRPDFYAAEKGLSATERGTAVHKVLEHMDFKRIYDYASVKKLVAECKAAGILNEKESKSVSVKQIAAFASSELYRRILSAESVYKEEAFTVAVKPAEIYNKYDDVEEPLILHGRIDCYFVENGEIVLIDYKTDFFDEESEEKFHERYDIQMELYKKALENVTGMKVRECCVYSVPSGKTIYF